MRGCTEVRRLLPDPSPVKIAGRNARALPDQNVVSSDLNCLTAGNSDSIDGDMGREF